MLSSKKNNHNQFLVISILGQSVLYLSLWLWNEYVASYMTLIFPVLILIILILALIADWIEPSRIPGWYYAVMIISILIPVLIGGVFYYINDGKIGWLIE
ncbi:MAG TPA: hypothetical protein VFG10_02430 [Saprospiraceae bacterium]|nr:hypothetical protein [Saprospiraceae bacterium]